MLWRGAAPDLATGVSFVTLRAQREIASRQAILPSIPEIDAAVYRHLDAARPGRIENLQPLHSNHSARLSTIARAWRSCCHTFDVPTVAD